MVGYAMKWPWPEKSEAMRWFETAHGTPTSVQAEAWPKIAAGHNTLIVSPTGTGKTLAAFLGVLHQLAIETGEGKNHKGIQALYISPLRALSYDLRKNLEGPLAAMFDGDSPITVGVRSGDTSSSERQKQQTRPPQILLTTPESLSLLLCQRKWLPALSTVRWVLIDEIHAMAENKRGAHLSLSLERLDHLITAAGGRLQRIGMSATVAPLSDVARFLGGTDRPCEIVDASSEKKMDLRVYSPLGRNPYPQSGYTGQRLIKELARLIEQNRTTLIFTNTRSGAEAATYWLHQQLPGLRDRIECHHASLDRDVRQEVEDRLKLGELRAVVCSTSLELGIDIGSIDLVVMLSTPKGVSKALQRTGRAGHNINTVSRGLLMATNANDLVESCATAVLARQRQLDAVRIPTAPLDVLAQHLAGMGCLNTWSFAEALKLVRRAYPYRDLKEKELSNVLDYLAGGGRSLRKQYSEVFGKIDLSEAMDFSTKPGRIQRDLLQNVGVIPNEGSVAVRLKRQTLGSVEENFIRRLRVGDVFMIGGRPVRLERVGMMDCFVSRADKSTPTVPRWNANKMPLSNRVAEEIVCFRGEMRERLEAHLNEIELQKWVADRFETGAVNAEVISRIYTAQHHISEIPTGDVLLVEEYLSPPEELPEAGVPLKRRRSGGPRRTRDAARNYFFHCLVGRAAADAISRVVSLRLSKIRGGNSIVTPDDYGFVLTVAPEQVIRSEDLPALLSPERFEEDLHQSLERSDLLQYHFRNAAQTGLMVYRNFFGEQKSLRKMQWSTEVIFNVLRQHEPDHVLMREARRDAVHTFIDIDGALRYVQAQQSRPARVRKVDRVPPLSFALYVTKIREALIVEDPREMMERLYHHWWSRIEEESHVKA